MKALLRAAVAVALLACGITAAAATEPLKPGRYVLQEGWGSLTVGSPGQKGQPFSIETVGGNAHVCGVDGHIRAGQGVPTETFEEACAIRFQGEGDTVTVESDGGCRMYCGARAGFDGRYRLPPPGCTQKKLRARQDLFLKQYRAKAYGKAEATMSSLSGECGTFFNWIEKDRLRNDLAITQHHLGKPQACLKTLQETRAWAAPDEPQLHESLPPSDFDNYIGVAKATWTNRRLCERALEKATPR